MNRRLFLRASLYVLLVAAALFYLMPVYVLLATGFKLFAEVSLARMWHLPSALHLDNFITAFRVLAPNLHNSLYVAVIGSILGSFLGSMNGYVLSKWKFRGADLVFTLILFGMFIPYQSILIPLVRFTQEANLFGGIPGLILAHVVYGIPITTLIFRNYYAGIPTEMVESAHIDGAGVLRIYWYVMLPLAIPGFVVALIWQFTSLWNDFLFAVTLTAPRSWPVTVALQNLAGSRIVEWNVQMAGAFLAALPPLLIYIFLGRFFLRGLMAGSLKG
ncbi:MAG TPA: carbohydrate ABC transporter permease [Levilinea sp.]|nr:carbohydrate ABC transporter permease [Levilinea sp.]